MSKKYSKLKNYISKMNVISQYHSYREPISRINHIDDIINYISRNELSKFANKVFSRDYLNIVEKL